MPFQLGPGVPEVRIGRSATNGVHLSEDRGVSKCHARIFLDRGALAVEDMGSRNGTFVNEVQVPAAQPLRPGDVIRIGNTNIVFRAAPAPARAGAGEPGARLHRRDDLHHPGQGVRGPVGRHRHHRRAAGLAGGRDPAAQHPPADRLLAAGPQRPGAAVLRLPRPDRVGGAGPALLPHDAGKRRPGRQGLPDPRRRAEHPLRRHPPLQQHRPPAGDRGEVGRADGQRRGRPAARGRPQHHRPGHQVGHVRAAVERGQRSTA